MPKRIWALLGAFVTLAVVYLLGVFFFFRPIAEADSVAGPFLSEPVAFVMMICLYIGFFAWVVEQMESPVKAGLVIALAQILLVNVDYVLTGRRGLVTAAASIVLLLVAWTLVGRVYGWIANRYDQAATVGGR
jgi:hypothetical protein